MIQKAFSLYDSKAQFFSAPFFQHHAGQAIRSVADLAADLNTTVGRHPADFQLYQVGTFDDQTGHLESCPPIPLGLAASFLPALGTTPGLFDKKGEN